MASGWDSQSEDWGMNPHVDHWGTFDKQSPVENFHEYWRSMRYRHSSTSGIFGLLVPSDWAVRGSAKPLLSYLFALFL